MIDATAPWALTPQERARCLRDGNYYLSHKVRLTLVGCVKVARIRDKSIATSDQLIATGAISLATEPDAQGWLQHRVQTEKCVKIVRENVRTGAYRASGRPVKDKDFGLAWTPMPIILSVMRLRGQAALVQRPLPPIDLTMVRPVERTLPSREVRNPPGRPLDPNSASARKRIWNKIKFIGEGP